MSVTTPVDLLGPPPSNVRGMRLGLTLDYGSWAVHPEIVAAIECAAAALVDAGAIVETVDIGRPLFNADDAYLWMQLWGVFMSAYFGHLVDEHHDRMDPDVLGLIALGNSLSATEYKRLEIARTDVWHRVAAALHDRDALLCPTMALPAHAAAKADRQFVRPAKDGLIHNDDMTTVWNLVAPCPVMSVPCGVHGESPNTGMPIGLQIVGRRWREDTVLRIGRAVEVAMPEMVGRRPPI